MRKMIKSIDNIPKHDIVTIRTVNKMITVKGGEMENLKKSLVALFLAVCILLAACGSSAVEGGGKTEDNSGAYHKITAETAKQMMDEGNVTVVDVRTEEEYKSGHIPGSILVPNEEIGTEQPQELPDLDSVLLVHCRTGIRSKEASDKLVKIGYKNVYDFGGIIDWPYETVEE